MEKVLIADFSNGKDRVTARGLWQFDRGVKLKVIGINVADVNRVDFATAIASDAVPVVVVPDGDGTFTVSIPGAVTKSSYGVTAYIYVDTADYGYTVKAVGMPVTLRPEAGKPGVEEKPDLFGEVVEKVSGYAKEAQDSAKAAAESEKAAAESATQAEKAKEASRESVEKAAESKEAAATSAIAAAESESQAMESAATARSAADQAAKSATTATESENTAAQLAENAAQSATNASGSAESASQSAETAKTAADAAGKSASAAQQAARSAAESASTASAAAQTATTAAGKAAESATSASQSAEMAVQKATTAETAASNAAESATVAEKSATAAKESATAAKTSETAAGLAAQTVREQSEKIKASAEQIEKNKAGVAVLKESVANKITKFYASNLGEMHITDSDDGKIQDMQIFGRSEQKKYNGYQLIPFNSEKKEIVRNEITMTKFEDGRVVLKGTSNGQLNLFFKDGCFCATQEQASNIRLKAGTYFFAGFVVEPRVGIDFYNKTDSQWIVVGTNKSVSFDHDVDIQIRIITNNGITYNGTVVEPMICEGTILKKFEPYVGGILSPSPEYPQEIESVVNPIVKVDNNGYLAKNETSKKIEKIKLERGKTYCCVSNHQGFIWNAFVVNTAKLIEENNIKNSNELYSICTGKYGLKTQENNVVISNNMRINARWKDGVNFTVDADGLYLYYSMHEDYYGTVGYVFYNSIGSNDPYIKHLVPIQYTLNAIPVSSGGNVTIDGQQYISDYIDVERGKLVRRVDNVIFQGAQNETWSLWNTNYDDLWSFMYQFGVKDFANESASKCNRFKFESTESIDISYWLCRPSHNPSIQIKYRTVGKDVAAFKTWLSKNPVVIQYILAIPTEIDLTPEEVQAFKALAAYYPVTNISINSEQLDGYTVFNYPISLANGWNYVKQQLSDNRDYIYDMDLQSAEAYVNSEYAVALTELEVM